MLITKVSIAGPDNHVKHDDLLALSREFPFVEWAILVASHDREDQHRYPGLEWKIKFGREYQPLNGFHSAVHYCGPRVLDWLHGKVDHVFYKRVQLNVRELSDEMIALVKDRAEHFSNTDIIIPLKRGTEGIWKKFNDYRNIVFLYDSSGGYGKTPGTWGKPIAGHLTGYAGGIGPENIKGVLKELESVVGDGFAWVDMESNVRTNNELDLDKVRTVLKTTKPYVVDM